MSIAIIRDDRYLEHSAGEEHPESPDRLRVIHSLLDAEFRDLPRIEPRLATPDELALVHDVHYIQAIAHTEGVPFSRLDMDTGLSARSWEISRLAAGGLLAGIDSILSPDTSRHSPHAAFAFVRPPGHHAEPDRGMGFCLFNNIAIAAEYAKKKHGLQRILIVDWDLHHGNGTQRAFYADPEILFFSSHQYPHYPGTGKLDEIGSWSGEGFTVNAPFPPGFGDAEYFAVYSRILKPIALEYKPQLVLVSAGFDPYVKDPLGGMSVTGPGFGALASIVREIAEATCGGKVLLTLEGGYNPEGLREGVKHVLRAFLHPMERTAPPPSPAAEDLIGRIVKLQKGFWKSLR